MAWLDPAIIRISGIKDVIHGWRQASTDFAELRVSGRAWS
jgi:hypothetical protein